MSETSRNGRQAILRQVIQEGKFTSQAELVAALAEHGIVASQSTLSKDLHAIGAVRQRTADGGLTYVLHEQNPGAEAKLAQLCSELLHTRRQAMNQLVLRTPPGAAQYFGSMLDQSGLPGIVGTIAGDDTVLVITPSPETASNLLEKLNTMTMTGRPMEES